MSSIRDRRQPVLVAQNMLTKTASEPQRVITSAGFSITLKAVSGTIVGAFKLQATDFGDTPESIQAADWVDIPSSSITWAGSTIGWNVADPNHSWIRIVFVDAGSTAPVVSANMTVRART